MIDVPFKPKAEREIDLVSADLMQQLHETARRKFGVVQARHKLVTFCRDAFECEIHEISITAAKYILTNLSQLPDKREVVLPPRRSDTIDTVIAAPPDPALWGPKL